jgi:gluconate 5-dehydrogenase
MMECAGQVALVTGAGRGLGRAAAIALARAGADVALVARSAEQIESTAGEIRALGRRAVVLAADITHPGVPEDLVRCAEDALGPLATLINAAGISPAFARAEKTSIADWDAVMNTNLRSAFLLCQAAGSRMLERGHGSVVNVASIAGLVALPRMVAYCAAKGGLVMLTKVLAVEWAPRGVRVNAVAPAFVDTALTHALVTHDRHGGDIVAQTPIGRLGQPGEVASAIVYLASHAASYVTGQVLAVDGGWTAR